MRTLAAVSVLTLGSTACLVDATDGNDPGAQEQLAGAVGAACIGPEEDPSPSLSQTDVFEILQKVGFFSASQQNFQLLFTGAWTNWSYDDVKTGLAKLATMRGFLDSRLYDMYLPGARAGNAGADVTCDGVPSDVRAIDGRCNDPNDPLMGAAGIRFGRNVPPPYGHGNPATLLNPNPREVSRKLLRRNSFKPATILNMLAAGWVQFQVHDWFSHGPNHPNQVIEVPLVKDDELSKKYGIDKLLVPITTPDPTRTAAEASLPPTYLNEVTHWWDASQVYGSDVATADRLRTFQGGKLRIENGLLPAAANGADDTGFNDNWWVGLTLLHTLFALEHNAIADMLAANNPGWTDQQLYDKARLINAALIARIHTLEWTPAILPNEYLHIGMNANWGGLNKYVEPPFPPKQFIPPGHPLEPAFPILYGIVGGDLDRKGVPYTLTEEFVSVYRMHPLLPELLEIRSPQTGELITKVPTTDTRNGGARALAQQYGLGQLMYSFGVTNPGALVLGNYPRFLQELPLPFGITDLATVDIIRDRERGVPRYNAFRQLLGLKRVATFEELTGGDKGWARTLSSVYGGNIDLVDLMVGTYAEGVRPNCYGFGETAFQVFTLMASRRLQADRFYTTDYNAATYTAAGINWIENNSMKTVLLRHFPQLGETGLASVSNAFMPWE